MIIPDFICRNSTALLLSKTVMLENTPTVDLYPVEIKKMDKCVTCPTTWGRGGFISFPASSQYTTSSGCLEFGLIAVNLFSSPSAYSTRHPSFPIITSIVTTPIFNTFIIKYGNLMIFQYYAIIIQCLVYFLHLAFFSCLLRRIMSLLKT